MSKRLVFAVAGMLALGWAAAVQAGLCPKCSDLMFIASEGKCTVCNGATNSGAFKLCPKCSAARHQCEHCQAALEGPGTPSSEAVPVETLPSRPVSNDPPAIDRPAVKTPEEPPPSAAVPIEKLPEAKPVVPPAGQEPPAAPAPIDPRKPGTYTSGKWQYRLEIKDPGTRSEGRWGWLFYDGQKLPRGEVNDYYRTPWGPIYWVDVPQVRWGVHGWMPTPLAQNRRPGRPLALPAAATGEQPPAANPSQTAPNAQTPPKSARSNTLEVTKADSGKLAKLRVGHVVVIRLQGNPTTGFQWQALPLQRPVARPVGQPQYFPAPATAGRVGAGGTYVFTFQAVQPGTGVIRLVYGRAWEKNRPPADTFMLNVEVQPSAATVPGRTAGQQPPPDNRRGFNFTGSGLY